MDIKSNKKSTFDTLYDKHADTVYQVSFYFCKDHYIAEDITQTVFMTLYKHMDNINMDNMEAWLKVTAKHMTLNYHRSHRHEKIVPFEEVEELIDSDVYVESSEELFQNVLDAKIRARLAEKIYSALYCENERWYQAVTVTYILERPQKEVAKTMGISLGALQLMLYRAKRWMRKRYQEEYDHLNDA